MNAQDIRSLNERMQEQMLNSKSVEGQEGRIQVSIALAAL